MNIKNNSLKRYIIALLLVVISLVVLVGYDGNKSVWNVQIQPEVVTEQHEIVSIEGNIIRGELVGGKGEGIYYTKQDFIKLGLDVNELKVGSIVEIGWKEVDYNNEDWEQVALLELVE